MKFTTNEIRRGMLLYAVTDRSWLKEGQSEGCDLCQCYYTHTHSHTCRGCFGGLCPR